MRNGQKNANLDERLARAQKKLALLETNSRLRAYQTIRKRQKRLTEAEDAWEWIGAYSDVIDRFRGSDRDMLFPFSTAADRRYGQNWPFWRTWQEHARLRAASRLVVTLSPLARGALGALTSYVVGKGMTTKVVAKKDATPSDLVGACQERIKEFETLNNWFARQRRLFFRGLRDGEYFTRSFPQDDGMTLLRTVEPECILEPPDRTLDEASFGIFTDPEDLEDVRGFWVAYNGMSALGEYVSAAEMIHHKNDVDESIKRGCPELAFDTLDLYKTVGRLLGNMGQGAAIQAAIAFARQHSMAPSAAISDFVGATEDYNQVRPFSGRTDSVLRFEPGTIIDMDAGQQFVPTPFAGNVPGFVEAVQALLRALATRWNAPEWVVSADASNQNYASSLTSESPFVKKVQAYQDEQAGHFQRIALSAFEHYCRVRGGVRVGGRRYSWREIEDLVEFSVVPVSIETRNRQEEASTNQTYIQLGVKSRQTVAQEQGLDWEVEERNNEEYEQKHGEQGIPQQMRTPEGGDELAGARAGEEEGKGQEGQQADEGGNLDELEALLDQLEGGSDIQEGVKKGKDRRGRAYCFDTDAHKRVPCSQGGSTPGGSGQPEKQKAGEKKVASKKERATPEQVVGHLETLRQKEGGATAEDAADLRDMLLGMTVVQLNALKKQLQAKAGGRKAELAERLAAIALERVARDTARKEPEPEPEPKPEPDTGDHFDVDEWPFGKDEEATGKSEPVAGKEEPGFQTDDDEGLRFDEFEFDDGSTEESRPKGTVATVLAAIQEIRQHHDAANIKRESDHIREQLEELDRQTAAGRPPDWAAHAKAEAPFMDKLRELASRKAATAETYHAAIARAIGGDSRIRARMTRDTEKNFQTIAAKGVRFLSSLLKGGIEKDVPMRQIPRDKEQRAHFDLVEKAVQLSKWDTPATAVHELGHWLENNVAGVMKAAREFVERRAGHEQFTSLKDKFGGHYQEYERGRKDDFARALGVSDDSRRAYYVGKTYQTGDTEVVSMGLELLFDDPAGFAERDEDYFSFIISILDGSGRRRV